MLVWLVMTTIASVAGSLYLHSAHSRHIQHPFKVRDWAQEPGDSHNGLAWPSINVVEEIGSKEIYHWVEGDVVEKYRSDLDGLLHLPGGCELTSGEYQMLQEFRRDAHYVQNCYCQEGGVYCKLKKSGEHVQIT